MRNGRFRRAGERPVGFRGGGGILLDPVEREAGVSWSGGLRVEERVDGEDGGGGGGG